MQSIFRYIISLVLLCTVSKNSFSQLVINADSLASVLKNEKTDTNTLKKYLRLIDTLDSDFKESKKEISNWILVNSKNNLSQKIRSEAYIALGNLYAELNEYPNAIAYYDSASTLAKANTYLEIEANAQFALSKIYIYHLTPNDALKAVENAIQLCLQINNKKLLAKSLFQKSFIIQYDYSKRNIDTGYKKIFELKEESIAISKSINDTNAVLRGYIGLAESYADNQEFDKAISYLKDGDNFKTIGIKGKSIIGYYFMFGKIYLLKGIALKSSKDIKQSIPFFEKSLAYASQYNNLDWKANNAGWLSSANYKTGEFKIAFDYLKKKNAYQDTINELENTKAINDLKRKYDFQLKENEITKLTNQNLQKSNLNKILIGSAIGLLLLSFLGYLNFKNKQKVSTQKQLLQKQQITQLEKDKQLLAVDAMLKGQEEERSRLAKDLHDGLGGMLSGVKLSFVNMKENMIMDAPSVQSFEASILQLDNTIAELRKVAHNLMPEALVKFGLKNAILDFCNSMQLSSKTKIIFEQMGSDRQLSNTADLYIYRIIQELINNALKHAQPKQILVQLTKAEKNILITVENDGNYFNTSAIENASGIGMKSVQQRVNYFTGKMDIASDKENGTSINIELNA